MGKQRARRSIHCAKHIGLKNTNPKVTTKSNSFAFAWVSAHLCQISLSLELDYTFASHITLVIGSYPLWLLVGSDI